MAGASSFGTQNDNPGGKTMKSGTLIFTSPLLALALCSASLALAQEAIDTRAERDA
jgi:hypothetical protein